MPLKDGRPSADVVSRVGGFGVLVFGAGALGRHRFAREGRLVDAERYRLQELSVGGDLFACLEEEDISHDELPLGYTQDRALPQHLVGRLLADLAQESKLPLALELKVEGDTRREDDG